MSLKSQDRRPSCGNTTASAPLLFFGGCYNEYNSTADKIQRLYNVTQVPSYAAATLGDPRTPYTRPEATLAPDCSPYYTGTPTSFVCGDGVNDNPYCGIPDPSEIISCSGLSQSFNVGKYTNCYASSSNTNDTTSLASCRHIGYKNVYAKKEWQGRKSYCSRELGLPDTFDWCCSCTYTHAEDPTPDLTRYLGMSATFAETTFIQHYDKVTVCNPSPDCFADICCWTSTNTTDTTYTKNASNATHVDQQGNFYVDTCSSASSGYDPEFAGDFAALAFDELRITNGDRTDAYTFYCAEIPVGRTPETITGGGDAWHVEYTSSYTCCDECDVVCTTTDFVDLIIDIDLSSGTARVQEYQALICRDGCICCYEVTKIRDEQFSIGCTTYSKIFYSFFRSQSVSTETTINSTLTGTLSTPYTSDDVRAQVTTLLSYWDMGNDKIYPWRTDASNRTKGPVVHFHEGPKAPVMGECVPDVRYTASLVIGKPATGVIGIDKIWNPSYANYCMCDSLVTPGCLSWYILDYGGWSDSIGVPLATDWLNDWEASQVPPDCAQSWTNQFYTTPNTCNATGPVRLYNDVLWACKYAQILFPKQSYSFARPCGIDRYQISESSGRCITGSIGNKLVAESTGTDFSLYAANDYVWVCGVSGIEDGMYKVSSVTGGYELTLGTGYISASILPTLPTTDCGSGMVGLLRWQTLKPAICGRISITSVTSGSNGSELTCSMAESTYLANSDSVIISSSSIAALNTTWTIGVIDNSTITLNGSDAITPSSYVSSSGNMRSYNSADYKWDDFSQKNDFRVQEYKYNYRDIGEYLRISSSYTPMTEQVECSSPFSACTPMAIPTEPRPYQSNCGMPWEVSEFTSSTQCIPIQRCAASVMYSAPAGQDIFTHPSSSISSSYNAGFTLVYHDTQYGSNWKLGFRQSCADLLYTTPPCVCSEIFVDPNTNWICDCNWLEDDGTCVDDTLIPCVKYYPSRNYYECRQELPTGAPALPAGINYGCLSLASMNVSATCPTGNICTPPWAFAPNVFGLYTADACNLINIETWDDPWVLFLNKYNCVCSAGRWTSEYSQNGIECGLSAINYLSPP
jgi:hypothetical protein